jgi:site-specific recombinase XerD
MPTNPVPYATARAQFLDYLKSQKKATATIIAYGKDLDQFGQYLTDHKISQVTTVRTEDIDGFKTFLLGQGYTPKSVSRKLNSIKTYFRYLRSQNIVEQDVAAAVAHPRYENKPPRILSKLEYRALRDAARNDNRIFAIIELMLQTGIRIGEVAMLTLEEIKGSDLKIPAYESHTARDVPLNHAAREALDRYLEVRPETKNPTLFVTKTGRPLLVRNIRTAIERYFKLAGIEGAKVNDLRHTFVAQHLMAGASPVLVSKLAGHKRLSTTERYLDLIKDQINEKSKLEEL